MKTAADIRAFAEQAERLATLLINLELDGKLVTTGGHLLRKFRDEAGSLQFFDFDTICECDPVELEPDLPEIDLFGVLA